MNNSFQTEEKMLNNPGIYKAPQEDFTVFWRRMSPLQRSQYIAMTADLILADPEYLANPPKVVLSRDEWIRNLEQVSDIILGLKR